MFQYNYVNGMIGFIGVQASPIASFAASYLQQRRSKAIVKDLSVQTAVVKKLVQGVHLLLGNYASLLHFFLETWRKILLFMYCPGVLPFLRDQLNLLVRPKLWLLDLLLMRVY